MKWFGPSGPTQIENTAKSKLIRFATCFIKGRRQNRC